MLEVRVVQPVFFLVILRRGGHPIPVFLRLISEVSVLLLRVCMRFDWQSVAHFGFRVVLGNTPLVRAQLRF